MFSKMIAGLRKEAEKVSGANYMLMADSHNINSRLMDQVSGKDIQEKTKVAGVVMGAGGICGIFGLAMANQAAAFGTVGLLSSASTAFAGLGTIAVGTAVLPFATVAVLGVAVAGIATFGISQLMPVDINSGLNASEAAQANDREALYQLGRQNVGMSDWLRGAKNLVVKSLRENFLGDRSLVIEAPLQATEKQVQVAEKKAQAADLAKSGDALDLYELEGLLSNSLEESMKGQQGIVDLVAGDVWEKLGAVIPDDEIHKCLGGTRNNDTFQGKILDVDLKTGLVIQSLGRGRATVHNLRDFEKTPQVGQDASISYKSGKMQRPKDLGNERDDRCSVER